MALALPVFGDIAYKSALLSLEDASARAVYLHRAFVLSPYDHIIAAGIVPTEDATLPATAGLDHPAGSAYSGSVQTGRGRPADGS